MGLSMSSNGRADQQLLPGVIGLRQPAVRSHPSIPGYVVSIRLEELRATIRGKCPCQMPWRAIECLSFLSALPLPDISSITFWCMECKEWLDHVLHQHSGARGHRTQGPMLHVTNEGREVRDASLSPPSRAAGPLACPAHGPLCSLGPDYWWDRDHVRRKRQSFANFTNILILFAKSLDKYNR